MPENLIESARTERIAVGPLSLGAIHRLLYARLDLVLTPPALRRVHEVAGGNPFFVLELGRALRAHPAHAPTEPLPVPDRLRQLLRDRLGSLSTATREAIAVAAAVVRPTRALIDGVTGDDAALQSAFDSGVLVADGEAVRFTHPLLASAAYEEHGLAARRALHARLADLVDRCRAARPSPRARRDRARMSPSPTSSIALPTTPALAVLRRPPPI